jgi:hypothetical protein
VNLEKRRREGMEWVTERNRNHSEFPLLDPRLYTNLTIFKYITVVDIIVKIIVITSLPGYQHYLLLMHSSILASSILNSCSLNFFLPNEYIFKIKVISCYIFSL